MLRGDAVGEARLITEGRLAEVELTRGSLEAEKAMLGLPSRKRVTEFLRWPLNLREKVLAMRFRYYVSLGEVSLIVKQRHI